MGEWNTFSKGKHYCLLTEYHSSDKPFKDEAQTALVKDPGRTAQ